MRVYCNMFQGKFSVYIMYGSHVGSHGGPISPQNVGHMHVSYMCRNIVYSLYYTENSEEQGADQGEGLCVGTRSVLQ